MTDPHLQISGLSKRFGGVQALHDVPLNVRPGEIMGLVGENGAGKSTIVKILTGIHLPDSGEIIIGGKVVAFSRPSDAATAGVAAIQQEPSMFDELTAAENIFAANYPRAGPFGLIDRKRMRREARRVLEDIGVDIAIDTPLKNLSVAEMHLVSLARALSTDAQLIIFDETTAALSQAEIQHLYEVIEGLKSQGKAIIFISHKLDEVFRICDRYTVLRDGVLAGTGDIADATQADIIRAMVGRTLDDVYPKAEASFGDTVLQVDGFCHATEFDDVSFDLRAGEILGFYGLVGAGRTEVMEALFGLKARKAGELRISGSPANIHSPRDAMAAGLAYVPEDRQRHGAILPFSVVHNISLPQLGVVSSNGFLDRRREEELVDDFGNKVAIKAAGWDQPVAELSGGNQQKVVIGKWLAIRPRIVILDEPTKGIDIGSKAAVHRMIGDLVQQGMAVILVTSELEEALGIADRLVVMARGRVVARFEREAFSSEAVIAAAAGFRQ